LERGWLRKAAPQLEPAETAIDLTCSLGYAVTDVRHILLIRLDRDHGGGIADFPKGKKPTFTLASIRLASRTDHDAKRPLISPSSGRMGLTGRFTEMAAKAGSASRALEHWVIATRTS
jgi:hypothetical protein